MDRIFDNVDRTHVVLTIDMLVLQKTIISLHQRVMQTEPLAIFFYTYNIAWLEVNGFELHYQNFPISAFLVFKAVENITQDSWFTSTNANHFAVPTAWLVPGKTVCSWAFVKLSKPCVYRERSLMIATKDSVDTKIHEGIECLGRMTSYGNIYGSQYRWWPQRMESWNNLNTVCKQRT